MASRSKTPPPKQPANLTVADMQAGIQRLQKRLDEVKAFDGRSVTAQFEIPHVDKLSAAVEDALMRTFGSESLEYDRYRTAAQFDNGPFNYAYQVPIQQVQQSLNRSKASSIALLEQAIESLQERIAEEGASAPAPAPRATDARAFSSKVFVVHGHDEGARESVARFLERLGFEAIILHEQASRGRTVIEKVEAHGDVGFAVVLLTPDDVGCAKGATPSPRARQNVVLELGYFIGRLGRERVCALKRGEVEIPSDFGGVVYVPFDDAGAWEQALGKELQAVGFAIDWSRAYG
jgi:predicted nucleotide-binding protein